MKKTLNKTLSLILVLSMLACLCPSAFAANVASGKWGQLSWTLNSNGLLTVTGSGEMDDFAYDSEEAWRAYTDYITGVSVGSGITSVGARAFNRCDYLETLSLPDGLKSIGFMAFGFCDSLESLRLPDSLETLGQDAFTCCTALKAVVIPSNVYFIGISAFEDCKSLSSVDIQTGVGGIGSYAFSKCTSLRSVAIPSTVKNIGSWPFGFCSSLTDIVVSSANESFCDVDGVMFNKSRDELVAFPSGRQGSYMIPSGVKRIGVGAFMGCALTSVTIPVSLTKIGNYNFYYGSLTDVYYAGTEAQWAAVSNNGMEDLGTATIHYAAAPTITYTVSYDANDGTGAPASQTKTQGTALTLSTTKPTRASAGAGSYTVTLNANGGSVGTGTLTANRTTSYSFKNWNTAKNGGGTSYNPGASYTADANATLYAQWNDSTVTAAVTLPTPTRSGYSFKGWGASSTATSGVTGSYTPNGNVTLYAIWGANASYTVSYHSNGGFGCPAPQTKQQGVPLTLSDITPTMGVLIQYNAAGGSVSPASKSINCTFKNWNTARGGNGTSYAPGGTYRADASVTLYAQWTYPAAGALATPTRSGYAFDGWFTAASGGTRVTESTVITENMTVYAHWTDTTDPYNMFDETYSFPNYGDADSPGGHCFGMSMTSAGYHLGLLDIARIGGSAATPLYSFGDSATVRRPICYYQKIQGIYAGQATVAGGSNMYGYNDIASDWREIVSYVRSHSCDNSGLFQIGFWKNGQGGHAVNFLRYENVGGQDRIYVYDNNFPSHECYFYQDSWGNVLEAPAQTFSGALDCMGLRDARIYFRVAQSFDSTHALYMPKDAASVKGYSYYLMEGDYGEEYVMYEIPADQDRVVIIPKRDYADFIYMDTEYSFGKITDDTRGELRFATKNEHGGSVEATFRVFENAGLETPDLTLPAALKRIEESAFEGISAGTVYVPDSCASIGAYAFRNAALRQIRVPAACVIADSAFEGCARVQIFSAPGSPAESFCRSHDNCSFVAEV